LFFTYDVFIIVTAAKFLLVIFSIPTTVYFHSVAYFLVSWGSSVSTVSGYGLDDLAIEVRSPAEAKEFFL
jgi:hypothetical protein